MDLFQNLLNTVKRGYGQVDKRVFGGFLPGGAATPIGEAYQRSRIPKQYQLSDMDRRKAAIVDKFTGIVADAQPVVEKVVKSSPAPVQKAISSGLNALPFSANLFGRYYTGVGGQGLVVPQEIPGQISTTINQPNYLSNSIKAHSERAKEFEALLKNPVGPAKEYRRALNDQLAETRSTLGRMQAGDVPYSGYETGTNPLTSPSTSIGRIWLTPNDNGYEAKDKYDFIYADADRTTPTIGPGIPFLTPSQEAAFHVINPNASLPPGAKPVGASMHSLTNLGRAIVMKMPDKSFTYQFNVQGK